MMKVVPPKVAWHALIHFDDPVRSDRRPSRTPRAAGLLDWHAAGMSGMGLDQDFATALCFRKAATPASDTSTHFMSGEASAVYSSCQFHHLYGLVWG